MPEFKIVPKNFDPPIIEANNEEDALVKFAWNMDSDMHTYFKAIPNVTTKEQHDTGFVNNNKSDYGFMEDPVY